MCDFIFYGTPTNNTYNNWMSEVGFQTTNKSTSSGITLWRPVFLTKGHLSFWISMSLIKLFFFIDVIIFFWAFEGTCLWHADIQRKSWITWYNYKLLLILSKCNIFYVTSLTLHWNQSYLKLVKTYKCYYEFLFKVH